MGPGTASLHTQLGFETLETRDLLSGVTAVLDHGVLTVTGSNDSNTPIHVWRQANRIVVDGVTGSFSASGVSSIQIACGQDGDQVVTLGIGRARGQTALARPVTVTSGNGNETVRFGSTSVYVAGAGHHVSVSARGVARLDGTTPDWFDTHIQDAAIRSLAKVCYNDHVLGRADMLEIFDEVEVNGTVTAMELADLQAIAASSALFSGAAYVQNLSAKVALGNHANALYQGAPLGNLAAGDSAVHLEQLVNKWFLGLDRPDSTYDNVTYAYAEAKAALFSHMPVYTDIWQGILGDCYFLAGLAEIALHNPGVIEDMFIVNGDGTYTVRFFNGRQADYVTVDRYLPRDSHGDYVFANDGMSLEDQTVSLWVPLAEKAYAQLNEEGWLRRDQSQNSYASIEDGWPNEALSQVTGVPARKHLSFRRAVEFVQFVSAYRSGDLLCFLSKGAPTNPQIVDSHVYAVVGYNAATRSVLLYNPWGIDNGSSYPGLLSLSWTEVAANFSSWAQSLRSI